MEPSSDCKGPDNGIIMIVFTSMLVCKAVSAISAAFFAAAVSWPEARLGRNLALRTVGGDMKFPRLSAKY